MQLFDCASSETILLNKKKYEAKSHDIILNKK